MLTRSFERHLARPSSQVLARIVRLGLPAIAATLVAASVMLMFGKPNVPAGELSGSAWFASQWNADLSISRSIKDGTVNALFLGYRGLPGVAFLTPWQQPVEHSLGGAAVDAQHRILRFDDRALLCWLRAAIARAVVGGDAAWRDVHDPQRLYLLFRRPLCWPPSIAPNGPRRPAGCCRCSPSRSGVFFACSRKSGSRNGCAACARSRRIFVSGSVRADAAEDLRRDPGAGRPHPS